VYFSQGSAATDLRGGGIVSSDIRPRPRPPEVKALGGFNF